MRKHTFLLADRSLSWLTSSFTIASSWIWAPALFLSSQKAYTDGVVGFFWFFFPNVLTLLLFGEFAVALRKRIPYGITLTAYMRELYGEKVHKLYLLQNIGLIVACLAVQLVAGANLISTVFDIPYFVVTILLASISISYTCVFGLPASVLTDFIKLSLLIIAILIIIPLTVLNAGGVVQIINGLSGISKNGVSFFSDAGINTFLTFGLPTSLGLIAGPFGDQAFYQRLFAIRQGDEKKAFRFAALLFAIVPLALCIPGFIAASQNFSTNNPSMVGFDIIKQFASSSMSYLFILIVIFALLSALDSHFTAVSSLAGHDLVSKRAQETQQTPVNDHQSNLYSRLAIIFAGLIAIAIANIPKIQILHLFLFYGTLRASTFMPTLLTVLSTKKFTAKSVAVGISMAFIIGLPVFTYGNLNKIVWLSVCGCLISIFVPGIVLVLSKKTEDSKN